MKAKELIKVLKQADDDAEVFVCGVHHLPASTISAEVKDYNGEPNKCVCIY